MRKKKEPARQYKAAPLRTCIATSVPNVYGTPSPTFIYKFAVSREQGRRKIRIFWEDDFRELLRYARKGGYTRKVVRNLDT